MGMGIEEASTLKDTRDELREIAKANSAKYATGTVDSLVILQDASSD